MAYSTPAEVRSLLVGVNTSPAGDYDLTPNQLSDDQVTAEIANADSEIDAKLANRYTVPFIAPIPELIHSLSIDIAAYLCDLRFRGARELSSDLHPFYLRYRRALDMLEKLTLGSLELPNIELDEAGGASVVNPYTGELMTTRHIFTRWPEGVISDG